MDEGAKKRVHITWEEAHRAEAERDKARRILCRSLPPSRMEVITVYVSRDLRKLTTSALRLWDVTCNHRLWPARYKRKAAAIAVFAAIILLVCVGTVSHLEQGKKYVFHPAVKSGAIAQRGVRNTSNPEVIAEASKRQYIAPQLSSKNSEPAQLDDRESIAKRARDDLGNFEVVDNSFVRDKPEANATIIATLRPGTQVSVEGKTEEYLRIRSLSDADVIGYVHKEDAFFERLNEDTSLSSDP